MKSYVLVDKSLVKELINNYLERIDRNYQYHYDLRVEKVKLEMKNKTSWFGLVGSKWKDVEPTEVEMMDYERRQDRWMVWTLIAIRSEWERFRDAMIPFSKACHMTDNEKIRLSLADIEKYNFDLKKVFANAEN